MGRRRQVRIAHAHVDDVGPGIARGRLGLVDLLEHVRRQTADAVKIFHGTLAPTTGRTESGNLRGDRNRIGFRSEVALNQGFRANSGARSSKPGPAMRLNWVLLPREPGSASFYGVFKQAPLRTWPPYFLAGFGGVDAGGV